MSDTDPLVDLSAFQQHTLAIIAELGKPHGLAVKDELEEVYQEEVFHGRLYPNVQELVDMGLVRKGSKDKRTNEYEITSRGRRELNAHINWLNDMVNGETATAD